MSVKVAADRPYVTLIAGGGTLATLGYSRISGQLLAEQVVGVANPAGMDYFLDGYRGAVDGGTLQKSMYG